MKNEKLGIFSVGKHDNASMDLQISSVFWKVIKTRPHYDPTINIVYSDQERNESEANKNIGVQLLIIK